MAEVVGLVASVVQVASSGVKLSRTLRDYGLAVQGYEKRLKGLDKDIYFTSGIISELATLLKDPRVQSLVSERSIELTREIVAEFEGMFQAIEDIIEGIRAESMGKWKIYFRESKIKVLLSNLDRLKGNLQLLIGVITHASQISTEHPDDPALISHRIKILELMVEKEEYTLKYLEEKRKYDNLMVHVNSNSTLASVSTIHSDNGATATWKSTSLCQESPAERDSDFDEPSGNGNKGKGVVTTKPQQAMLAAIDETEGLDNEVERRMENIGRLKGELMQLQDPRGLAEDSGTSHDFSSIQPTNLNNHDLGKIAPNIISVEGTVNAQEVPPRDTERRFNMSHQTEAFASGGSFKSKPERRRKRDVASKVGKKAIKGTGYAIGGTFALVLFPITLPLWWWRRKRRSQDTMSMPDLAEDYMHPVVANFSHSYSPGVARPLPPQSFHLPVPYPLPQQPQTAYIPQLYHPAYMSQLQQQVMALSQQQVMAQPQAAYVPQQQIQPSPQQQPYPGASTGGYYGQHLRQQHMLAELPTLYELGDRPDVSLLHELTVVGGQRQ